LSGPKPPRSSWLNSIDFLYHLYASKH
jgi:hypothetical protein